MEFSYSEDVHLLINTSAMCIVSGCTAFGSTYQEYVGYTIFGNTCMMRSMSNTSLQNCLDMCTSLERCLSVSFHQRSDLCVAHQCSFVTHPQDWGEWNAETGTTSYVKDCDHDQAIGKDLIRKLK